DRRGPDLRRGGRALVRPQGPGATEVTVTRLGFGAAPLGELLAMRYTLLDHVALEQELPLCEERNVSVVAGALFDSGILATGAVAGAMYDYRPAPEAILERVRRMRRRAGATMSRSRPRRSSARWR